MTEKLAVSPAEAFGIIDVKTTHGYKLINSGELQSYLEGRRRKITMESIRRYIERRLAATKGAHLPYPNMPPKAASVTATEPVPVKRTRGRPRKNLPAGTSSQAA